MATKLKKAVQREIAGWCKKGAFGMGGGEKRNLIVAMEPGNIFTFREKGRRKVYEVDMETVYYLAVKATANADMREKNKQKELNKLVR